VHYRQARRKRSARSDIRAALADVAVPLRTIAGKMVVNLVPARAPNKGQALLDLCAKERAEVALYVGDDVTDEDVFELGRTKRMVTVRVRASKASTATYFVRDQAETDTLLQSLIALRQGRGRV
jgi:trehalose 6-phosphate phosphatase